MDDKVCTPENEEKHLKIADSIKRLKREVDSAAGLLDRVRGENRPEEAEKEKMGVNTLGNVLKTAPEAINKQSGRLVNIVNDLNKVLF